MKVSPEQILLRNFRINTTNKIYLITGNEETLIQKITEIIALSLKKNGIDMVVKKNEKIIELKDSYGYSGGLFNKGSLIIYDNPKDIKLESLKKKIPDGVFIVIKDSSVKNNSKIKKWFDADKDFLSISCYKLTADFKKNLLTKYLDENKISLEKESFWFFIENTDDRYGLFEAELNKLLTYANQKIKSVDFKKLISEDFSEEIERVFFIIAEPDNKIITKSNKILTSPSKAYSVIFQIRLFLNILIKSQNINDINKFFPKYLFKDKDKFIEVYKKSNQEKIVNSVGLIKKTEILLRKHENLFLQITQRFLLNLKKNLIK